MKKKPVWVAAALWGALVVSAGADPGPSLRFEGVGNYHYNGSAQVEYAFRVDGSSLAWDGGASYGIRDWWNSLSVGATWYPWSAQADGFFTQAQETYGFGLSGIQGDTARDWKTTVTLGYRWMAFGWLTGSVAAGANYDAMVVSPAGGPKDFNAGGPKGLNPAVVISLGVELTPHP
jgi:hypothetical protein